MKNAKEITLSKWVGTNKGDHALPTGGETAGKEEPVKALEHRSNFSTIKF